MPLPNDVGVIFLNSSPLAILPLLEYMRGKRVPEEIWIHSKTNSAVESWFSFQEVWTGERGERPVFLFEGAD